MTDPVVIIGAGPAGMTLGHILHRHGVPCVVFDRRTKENIYETGRAGLFDHTAAMIVDQYDLSDRINTEEWLTTPLGKHKSCYFSKVYKNGEKKLLDWSPVLMIEEELRQSGGNPDIDMYNPLYPQTELVLDMHNKAEKVGLDVRFGVHVESVSGFEPGSEGPAEVHWRPSEGAPLETLKASYVVGCGGYHDPVRKAMRENTPDLFVEHAVDWGPITLGLFADSVPSTDKIIYGFHPDGMAAHMIRTKDKSRYYLEVESDLSIKSKDDTTDTHKAQVARLQEIWTDDKIWKTLIERLGIPDLDTGKITSKQFFRTQHFIVESMNIGRACVAGDAAHSRPYLGARGANNAMQDSYVLAEILVKAFKDENTDFLKADLSGYSKQRVHCNWESAKFTYEFYRICFGTQGESQQDSFQQAMANPIFEQLEISMAMLRNGEPGPKNMHFLAKWMAYCYVQPCVKASSVDEWFDIKPAGLGVRKIKSK